MGELSTATSPSGLAERPSARRRPRLTPAIPRAERVEPAELRRARARMVESLRARGIVDVEVLAAMARIPRQLFVPEALAVAAYGDHALPVLDGQTVTQPHTVALCVQEVRRAGASRVLEIGTGSGYQAAVLAAACRQVFSVERHPRLIALARANLDRLGVENVALLRGDGAIGWSRYAPYDAIVVAAAAAVVPPALVEQLVPGGRLLVPVGPAAGQELLRVTRTAQGVRGESLGPCSFVPLVTERAPVTRPGVPQGVPHRSVPELRGAPAAPLGRGRGPSVPPARDPRRRG